ncbi:2-C-methyl-D-erythritol 4-phosphate cytidylyltransferase [Melioribacter sp. OK-6-Me]|uniref:2-C-methyl-D-erythritol 4-phosphate cytidylyltransferase n=1 Tax=unclassified Melioribacter TaxID=2627329 RepID=UPI003EDA1604
MEKVIAIIPAGGTGKRLKSSVPKQFIRVNGKEIIAYTLHKFQKSSIISEIIVATHKDYITQLKEIKDKYSFDKLKKIITGGSERQYSVYYALNSIDDAFDEDIVIVHDAVRPLVTDNILISSVDAAKKFGCFVTAIKAKDTLIEGEGFVNSYLDRSKYYYAQTPQGARYGIFKEAFEKAAKENFLGTDESMLFYRNGNKVKIVEGSSLNFKITTEDDLKLFELLLKSGEHL